MAHAKAHPLTSQVHTLRKQGFTQQAIADMLGLAQLKVSRILNLETNRENARESNRRYRARQHTALVDLTEQGYEAWVKDQSKV